MSGLSGKARERLLYLISPIALLLVWQALLMLGIGDRRFVPAPSDIAFRFVRLIGSGQIECSDLSSPIRCVASCLRWLANGELKDHVAVTLYRVFFGALPTIFAGLRIALAVSFIVLVASEFVATKAGIGYLIWNSWELLQVDVMFVGIVTIGIIGLITSALFQELERWAIPWKAS